MNLKEQRAIESELAKLTKENEALIERLEDLQTQLDKFQTMIINMVSVRTEPVNAAPPPVEKRGPGRPRKFS